MSYEATKNECHQKIVEAQQEMENIECLTKDPACLINKHFDLINQHINWRIRDLMADILSYQDHLLKENEVNRSKCFQYSTETYQIATEIDKVGF